ncbi:MAG: restriction endonuclease [Bacteroidota bacterium]
MTIKVFEHQTLRIGTSGFEQRHFEYLSQIAPVKYFQLVHRSVRFSQYVGAVQVGDLTIEILPKIDRRAENKSLCRDVLLDMLRYCRLLKVENLGTAQLGLKSHSILDLYYELFLGNVEEILHQGIYHDYHLKTANRKTLKGRLNFEQQIRENWLHKERFFTSHHTFSTDNQLNRIISYTLQVLDSVELSADLKFRLNAVKARFPQFDFPKRLPNFERIRYNRQNLHYQNTMQIAQLLLLHYRPNLRTGKRSLIALLFDMNLLFEEFIFRQLCTLRNAEFQVSRQQQKEFWNKRYIRPDILLVHEDRAYIIDTKWKVLTAAKPSMSDLQQAFAYGQYFQAENTILLYPQNQHLVHLPPKLFQLPDSEQKHYCSIYFAELIKNGKLNLNIGKELKAYYLKNRVK